MIKQESALTITDRLKRIRSSKSVDHHVDFGILLELGSIGAGHAATSLSEMLQEPITIDVPQIHSIPSHKIPNYYNKHDSPTTAVLMKLGNGNECDILLLFEEAEAKKIAMMITMSSSLEELTQALEESAIQELANIIIGSFLTAISDFIGVNLVPTTPKRVVDIFDAIIDNFLAKHSESSHGALIFETRFKRREEDANSILMIFPSPQLEQLLTGKSKKLLE